MTVTVQTSYSQRPSEAFIGQLAEGFSPGPRDARTARGLVKAGYGVFKVPGTGARGENFPLAGGEVFHIANPDVGVDDDAILTTLASATATLTTYDSSNGTAGVVGFTTMQPARKLTVTFDSSTDWDPTTGHIYYLDQSGKLVSETIAVATSATRTTTGYASQFVKFTFPAQTGTGGTAKIGIGAMPALTIDDFEGVAIRQVIKTTLSATSQYGYPGVPSNVVTADYIDGETVPLLKAGGIWVYAEEAMTEMDKVYIRITAGGGGSALGAFRNDADSASCVVVPGARVARSTSAAGPCWVRFPSYW